MNNSHLQSVFHLVEQLYPEDYETLLPILEKRIALSFERTRHRQTKRDLFSHHDVLLIAYGDHLQDGNEQSSLKTLAAFCNDNLAQSFSMVHLLPFYPSTSDDGFAVSDYRKIDQQIGDWEDIEDFKFYLMFDGVFNHVSASSDWFQSWLQGNQKYQKYFISFSDEEFDEGLYQDIAKVTRPRPHPLLTPFETKNGLYHVWTTFSEDQIDVNFSHPQVFLEIVDVLLFYFEHHAHLMRVDAVPFFWKELGTNCSHHPKTHLLVKCFRAIMDCLEKKYLVVTESNVPFKENISYFGNGQDEAHVVYNFTLPPLLAHGILKEDATHLQEWSKSISSLSDQTTFLNFLASHDGIGVRGLEGVVAEEEMLWLCQQVTHRGGLVSYRMKDGEKSPYELNITWASLLHDEKISEELNLRRFVASYLMAASLPGIPAIYFSSLFAAFNDQEGVESSGINRRINRERFHGDTIQAWQKPDSFHGKAFQQLLQGLELRRSLEAFHPNAEKIDLSWHPKLWCFMRCLEGKTPVLVIYNLSSEQITLNIPVQQVPSLSERLTCYWGNSKFELSDESISAIMEPHDIAWIGIE